MEPSEDAQLLITGARYGDVEDVTMALDAGVSVDAVDSRGCTGAAMHHCHVHTYVGAPFLCMLFEPAIPRLDVKVRSSLSHVSSNCNV